MSKPQGVLGNKYVAGAVGIILALVIAYNVQFFINKNKTASPANVTQQVQRSGSPPQERTSVRQPEKPQPAPALQSSAKEDKGPWKRDPFSLQAGTDGRTAGMTDDIRITGIIKKDGKGHVLINGKVYGVNDRIGKAVIREIRQHSIVLLAEGKKQEISFDDYKVIKEKKK